jgi:antitoxin MazE
MRVSKWGNSLVVRLPKAVVDALDLKEGDQIEIRIAGERVFEVSRDQSKPHALARLQKLRGPLPPGFVFDREDAVVGAIRRFSTSRLVSYCGGRSTAYFQPESRAACVRR